MEAHTIQLALMHKTVQSTMQNTCTLRTTLS